MKGTALAVVALLVLGSCGGGDTPSTHPPTIVWINPIVGHPVYVMQDEAFRWAEKDCGFKGFIDGPAKIDAESMVRAIENAIAQKVDGIVTVPLQWSAFKNIYEKAKRAGIPIVNTGTDTPPEWRLSFIGTDNIAYGKEAARILIEKTGGKAGICIMMSALDAGNQVEQKTSFEEAIQGHPDMKILVVEADKADLTTAIKKFEEIYRAYPGVNTVVMLEATGGAAAAKVAREMKILDKVTILAIDDIEQTVDEVRKGGIWGTLAQNFYRMGYESAGLIMAHRDQKEVPSFVDSQVTLITKENVETYKKLMIDAIRKGEPAR